MQNKKWLILIILIFLLSGCAATNKLLVNEGEYGNYTTLPVDVSELTEMAQYCIKSYEKPGRSPDDPKFAEFNDLFDSDGQRLKEEFSYYLLDRDGVSILVFRGTDNRENVKTDVDIRMHHGKDLGTLLHMGFRNASHIIYSDIKRNYKLRKTIYLTGHSLGGAIAQIIGLWFHEEGYNVQIYTFGSPKVATTFFGNRPIHFRVALRNDPVPFFPSYPFLHSGIYIDPETLDWDETHLEEGFLKVDARDHSIQEYYDTLMEHMFPQLCDECK